MEIVSKKELDEFLYDIDFLIEKYKISKKFDDSLIDLALNFRNKFRFFNLSDKISNNLHYQEKLIFIINKINFNEDDIDIEFINILWKCYLENDFDYKLNKNKIFSTLRLFCKIGYRRESKLNNMIDKLIVFIIEKCSIKEILVNINLLINSSDSTILRMKLIFLFLFLIEKSNFNVRYYDMIISNIASLITKEFDLLNQHYHQSNENKLLPLSLNILFLQENFFNLLSKIVIFISNSKQFFIDYSDRDVGLILNSIYKQFSETKSKSRFYDDERISSICNTMIFANFLIEILNLIYPKFIDKKSLETSNIEIGEFNVYFMSEDFKQFHCLIISKLFNLIRRNILYFAELLNIQKNYLTHDEEIKFSIYKPMNEFGVSYFYWILLKNIQNFTLPLIISPIYLLDIYLPFISILIKNGELNFFIAFEILFKLLSLIENKGIDNISQLKFYPYSDLFIEIVERIGLPFNLVKKQFIVKNIGCYLNVLSDDERKKILSSACKRTTKNDGEVAYVLYLVKSLLNEELSSNNLKKSVLLLDKEFLFDLVYYTLDSENSFDKIEDLTQCLNFLFYLINFYLKSKGLLVPSDETIRTIIKTLDNLYNKLNTLIFSLNESKDETSEIQKSKIYIALNLISNVENIVKHINK